MTISRKIPTFTLSGHCKHKLFVGSTMKHAVNVTETCP